MDSQAPIKSVLITGNLKNSDLKYILCPSTEFSAGVWHMCISSVAYSSNIAQIKELCEISCNLVKAQKYSASSYEVESYNQPFAIFLLEDSKSKKNAVYFGYYI